MVFSHGALLFSDVKLTASSPKSPLLEHISQVAKAEGNRTVYQVLKIFEKAPFLPDVYGKEPKLISVFLRRRCIVDVTNYLWDRKKKFSSYQLNTAEQVKMFSLQEPKA